MSGKIADTAVVQRVELAISRLNSLSTLPCVAVRFLSEFLKSPYLPSALAETIESDPALIARLLSVMHQQGLSFKDEKFSVRRVLDKIPSHTIRDTILSVKVFQEFDSYSNSPISRRQLVLHCLAVACCAEDIAEIVLPKMDSRLVYLAGLLHNIGNLALHQAMPKSFARIVEEAKSKQACICAIEREQLGLDYTLLGKRLAQKWHFPNEIILAIWMHHSNTDIISQGMPEARIAQIVQLANSMARQCNIGQSGSYDLPELPEQTAQSLGVNCERLQQIRERLGEQVRQKSRVLGLDLPNAAAAYCNVIHTTVARLARVNTKLSLENHRLQTNSSNFDFITDFLSSINSTTLPIEIAENFAVRWQKFYQTGIVCVYLAPPGCSQVLEAVVVESPSQIKTVILNIPADLVPIPQVLAKDFAILDPQDSIDWLFEQLDVDFKLSQTKLLPLLSDGRAIGVIVFELRCPAETEKLEERFEVSTSIAGVILDMAFARQRQQRFAERFVQLAAEVKTTQRQLASDGSLSTLAEVAAGVAHELNNPLSVVSGRAQLLAEAETDPKKKRILEQIKENTNEISGVIEELMSFAKPLQPRPTRVDIEQMLDEAIQLTAKRTNNERLDVQIDVGEGSKNVFVDSAQIVSAIANIFCNCLDSYTNGFGPIKVTARAGTEDFVKLVISDSGCGMDTETVQKATQPFFSAKPAGRKRGMGLAHAARLIQLNNGSLDIASQPGSGTTVIILLRKCVDSEETLSRPCL